MSDGALKLRSDKFASVQVTAPTGGYTAGQMADESYLIGVIVNDADIGDTAVLVYRCEKIVVPKNAATGVTFAVGSKVYYDSSENEVTNSSTGNTLCGRALEVAGASATEVLIDLDGAVIA